MSWFIVFVMITTATENYKEIYTINSISFNTEQECRDFVGGAKSNRILKDHILTVFPLRPVKNVYCIRQDALNEMIKDYKKKEIK